MYNTCSIILKLVKLFIRPLKHMGLITNLSHFQHLYFFKDFLKIFNDFIKWYIL